MTDDPNDEQPFDAEAELPEDESLDDEEAAEAEEAEGEEEAAAPTPAGRGRDGDRRHEPPHHRTAAPASAAALAARDRRRGIVVDPSLRIRDRWSQAFVLGTVLVFALIFFNALAFGHGGALSPTVTPGPSVEATIGPSIAPVQTPAPVQTEFQVPTHSPGPSASASPAAS